MIPTGPSRGNKNSQHEKREIRFSPYVGTRAVTKDQITQALARGLTVDEIHHRFLDAECLLMTAHDPLGWDCGWLAICDGLEWCDTPANVDESGLTEGLKASKARYQSIRQSCYAAALSTGTPDLDVVAYSDACGRVDCCECGMWFMHDRDNDWTEMAGILRKTRDRRELWELAMRLQAIAIAQQLMPIWTPFPPCQRQGQAGTL